MVTKLRTLPAISTFVTQCNYNLIKLSHHHFLMSHHEYIDDPTIHVKPD